MFWGTTNRIYFFMKLPYLSLLITVLCFLLIDAKVQVYTKQQFENHSNLRRAGVFLISFVCTVAAIEGSFYGITYSVDYSNKSVAIIATNLPFLIGIIASFVSIYEARRLLFQKSQMDANHYFRAILGPFNLVLQLTSVFFFAECVDLANKAYRHGAPLACAFYPIMIGVQKGILFLIVEPFDMQEVYEFASLAFAAMPYRFIYLTLDEWDQAAIVFAIKYFYKFIVYFSTLKYEKHIKSTKKNCKHALQFWKSRDSVIVMEPEEH